MTQRKKQKKRPPNTAKVSARSTPRRSPSSGWDKSLRGVFEDRSAPAAVRVAALDALTEGLQSLDERARAGLLTWANRLLQNRLFQDWRIRFRLEVLVSAAHASGNPSYQAKWSMPQHWKDLSQPALAKLGWPKKDVDAVVDANLATDLDWVAAKWWGRPYALLWPNAYARVHAVRALKAEMVKAFVVAGITEPALHEPHFDDLFTYDRIERSYTAFAEWSERASKAVAKGSRDLLDLLGLVHHAIQDFYCHTNWVEICLRMECTPAPTWEQVAADPVRFTALRTEFARSNSETIEEPSSSKTNPRSLGGLQSGAWTLEHFGKKRPWRHRHPEDGEPAYKPALEVAVAATKAWTARLAP
ncbi:MAG: hypothetical protein ABIP94_20440 [Planctomycetota bacterium]